MVRGRRFRHGAPLVAGARGVRRRLLLAGLLATPAVARAQDGQELRGLARRAASYLTPPYDLYVRRHRDIVERGQKFNRLLRQLSPEGEVLAASAWLDLSVEPLFLSLPAMGNRLRHASLAGPFGDSFAPPGAQAIMIAGPGWKGDAPGDVALIRTLCRTTWLRLAIGIVRDDDDDLEEARGLQARVLLETPDQRNERRILEMRELMRFRTVPPPEPAADWPAPRPAERFDLFDGGLAMLGECVLSDRDRSMLEELEPLHLKPGRRFDARAFGPVEREAIAAGIADAAVK